MIHFIGKYVNSRFWSNSGRATAAMMVWDRDRPLGPVPAMRCISSFATQPVDPVDEPAHNRLFATQPVNHRRQTRPQPLSRKHRTVVGGSVSLHPRPFRLHIHARTTSRPRRTSPRSPRCVRSALRDVRRRRARRGSPPPRSSPRQPPPLSARASA